MASVEEDGRGGELDARQEVALALVVAGGDPAELLELGEEVLDQVPRLTTQIAQQPLPVGLVARITLGPSVTLEFLSLITRYTRRRYLLSTTLGVTVWATQTVAGVTLLRTTLISSPGHALAAAVVPLAIGPALVVKPRAAMRRRRAPG